MVFQTEDVHYSFVILLWVQDRDELLAALPPMIDNIAPKLFDLFVPTQPRPSWVEDPLGFPDYPHFLSLVRPLITKAMLWVLDRSEKVTYNGYNRYIYAIDGEDSADPEEKEYDFLYFLYATSHFDDFKSYEYQLEWYKVYILGETKRCENRIPGEKDWALLFCYLWRQQGTHPTNKAKPDLKIQITRWYYKSELCDLDDFEENKPLDHSADSKPYISIAHKLIQKEVANKPPK